MPLEGDFRQQAEASRAELVELVADVDEQLAESFLAEEPISPADLAAAIRRATLALKFVPVFMGRWGALTARGIRPVLRRPAPACQRASVSSTAVQACSACSWAAHALRTWVRRS